MQAFVCALLVVCVGVVSVAGQTVEDRAVAAIVGAFVADAAAMPLHWIYNVVCAYRLLMIFFGNHLLSHLRLMLPIRLYRTKSSILLALDRPSSSSLPHAPTTSTKRAATRLYAKVVFFGAIATKLLASLCSRLSLRMWNVVRTADICVS